MLASITKNIECYNRHRYRGVAQLARATVSKTVGRGFESLHPCQARRESLKTIANMAEAVVPIGFSFFMWVENR